MQCKENTRYSRQPGFCFGWWMFDVLNKLLHPRQSYCRVIYLDFFKSHRQHNPVQKIKVKDLCYITVLNTAECLHVHHLWISQSICQGGGWARGWSARLRGDTPSKGPQWGSFVQLLSRVHPNPQEPPVTATGKWGMLKEVGVGCAEVDRFCRVKAKRVTV